MSDPYRTNRPADGSPPPRAMVPPAQGAADPLAQTHYLPAGLPTASPVDSSAPASASSRLGRASSRRPVKEPEVSRPPLTATQRLLILDAWRRSGLPARDFAPLVGISRHTLYAWKKKFDAEGPAGLEDHTRGAPSGSRLPEVTRRAILMMKEANPDWGVEKISALLLRGPALPASPQAVARVLHEAGYQTENVPTKPHPDHVRRFERARPNQLWQTDLFTFVLKRRNRRVYLVAFMDDHSPVPRPAPAERSRTYCAANVVRRPLRRSLDPYAEGVVSHSPGSRSAPRAHADDQGSYAEGVVSRSPGSRSAPWVRNVERLGYAEGVVSR